MLSPYTLLPSTRRRNRDTFCLYCLSFLLSVIELCVLLSAGNPAIAQPFETGFPVTTVSAINFERTAIAPQSLVAGFGILLASSTEPAPAGTAPTTLGGTMVEVNGVRAGLLAVSPNQINYIIPAGTAIGTASVVITSGNGFVSRGTVEIRRIAPVIFTANFGGSGVVNGQIIRVAADGSQSPDNPPGTFQLNSTTGSFITRPLSFGPADERLFGVVVLSGTSLVTAADNLRVIIGGVAIVPSFFGTVSPGLEQANFEIPRSLIGRGLVNLAVSGEGFGSNITDIEFAAPPAALTPAISSISQTNNVLAGQPLTLNGNFAIAPVDNVVQVSGIQARLISSSASQISLQVPFGSQSGQISVTSAGRQAVFANPLAMRTSVSGYVEDTSRQPLSGVRISQVTTPQTVPSMADGSFVFPDPFTGTTVLNIDGATVATNPAYPQVQLKKFVTDSQDNFFDRPIALQQNTGVPIPVGGGGPMAPPEAGEQAEVSEFTSAIRAKHQEIIFEVPSNLSARFPDGSRSGLLFLTRILNSRTPVNLPPGIFSSSVAQIAPFDVSLFPGATLTFPNGENIPAGTRVMLYQLNQTPFLFSSSSGEDFRGREAITRIELPGRLVNQPVSSFEAVGEAFVSADGQTIQTAENAIKKTGIFFMAKSFPITTVVGRVADCQCRPVSRAVARSRGQEIFVDNNGNFILRYVPVLNATDKIPIEVSYFDESGKLQSLTREVTPVIEGVTVVKPDFVFNTGNCPYAENQVVSTSYRNSFVFRLKASATGSPIPRFPTAAEDARDAALTYIITQQPKGEFRFTIGSPLGQFPYVTYCPRLGFYGIDSFKYKVSNGCAESEEVTVHILVRRATD
jgi:uncharacterized protein (TIGR03437 family)